jgi:hypothetical protein
MDPPDQAPHRRTAAAGEPANQPPGARSVASSAEGHGMLCASAIACLRHIEDYPTRYWRLFPPEGFPSTVFSATAMVTAFTSPGTPPAQLRVAVRSAIWVFAADWLVDHVAQSTQDIRMLAEDCLDAVAPAPSTQGRSDLAQLLREQVYDEIATASAFPAVQDLWRTELRRYWASCQHEWEWGRLGRGAAATLDDYLADTDNFGSMVVNLSHWITQIPAHRTDCIPLLLDVSRIVQRILRLLNDLATHHREHGTGDVNAILLGFTPSEVNDRITTLIDEFDTAVAVHDSCCPEQAQYLRRQTHWCRGFYSATDFRTTP